MTVYLAESYSQNADLELIHSEPASKEVLADQVVNSLQRLSKVQAEERAQLTLILENQSLGSQNYRNSYLAVRSAKDQLLFASLQTLAATLHPSLPLPKTFNFSLTYCTPFIGMISWKQ